MRLLTYNIHGCVGRGGRTDPESILSVIEEADADVVALQEVHDEDAVDRSFLRDLENRLDYPHVLHDPLFRRGETRCGNVVMTRLPPSADERIDLSQPGREPRGAIRIRLPSHDRDFEITATHLGLAPRERRAQIRRLAEPGPGAESVGPDTIRILMGDLNEWFPFGRAIRLLRGAFGTSCHKRTFPAAWPLFALDRVHVLPSSIPLTEIPLRSRAAQTASDHLPLAVELDV